MPPADPPDRVDVVELALLGAQQDGVVTRAQVLAAGVPPSLLRRRLATGAWEPLLRGSYLLDPHREGGPLQRSWARAAVLTVPGAVLGMGTAAALHGLDGVPRRGAVDVLVDREVTSQRGRLRPHRFAVAPAHVVDLAGLPTTSVVRTLADLVPRLERPDALAVLDCALRLGLVDAVGLADAERLARCRPWARGAADLWSWADGRAETPIESRARLRCLDQGLVPDGLQVEVRDEHGHLLARGDMTFRRARPGAPVAVLEADGRGPHDAPRALYRDRWRANALVALGHPLVRCTWQDTVSRLAVPTMVRAAL